MTNAEKLTLAKHACHIRMGVIEGTHSAKCGHPGGSLDIAELLSYLYFVEMNIDPKDPKMAARMAAPINVYTIVGDGEVEEGECWEAFMFAAHYGLSNLCVVLDRNHLQIDGTTETVMNSAPLEEKLKAFNFNVVTIDGHDYDQIEAAMQAFHAENDKPTCIIMDTTKGKGVSFMTNSVDWHGKGPNDDEYKIAIEELNAAYAALEQEEN